jgi:hypothetical protein
VLTASHVLTRRSSTTTMGAATFINSVNTEYEALHKSFEQQFWGTKMALSDESYSVEALTRTKGEMEAFLADEEKLKTTREHLAKGDLLSDAERQTLTLFERTFLCYIMESEEAKTLRTAGTQIEGKLEDARNKMRLGATIDGKFVELSSVGLRSKMRVDPSEEVRSDCMCGRRGGHGAQTPAPDTRRCAAPAGRGCARSATLSSPTASSSWWRRATRWPRRSGTPTFTTTR